MTTNKLRIIFLIGKPAIGKTTLIDHMVKTYDFDALKIGLQMRLLAQKDEKFSQTLSLAYTGKYIPELGKLARSMFIESVKNSTKFLIVDGYPRYIEQLQDVENFLPMSVFCYLTTENEDEIIFQRLSYRTSENREDDKHQNFIQRSQAFDEDIQSILSFAEKFSKIIRIEANQNLDKIGEELYNKVSVLE